MDENEFSFKALFKNSEFKRYTSPEYQKAYSRFYKFLEDNLNDREIIDKFESEANLYCSFAEDSGFMQGFCFAVKIIKFLNKI